MADTMNGFLDPEVVRDDPIPVLQSPNPNLGGRKLQELIAEDRRPEFEAVVAQLRSVLREEPAQQWLQSPNPDLGGRIPLVLIAEGEYDRVIASVQAMAEGVTA